MRHFPRYSPRNAALPALCLGLLVGCVDDPQEVDAAAVFAENCAACHGSGGRGDGPMAGNLTQILPDLTTIARRNGGTFPRDQVMSIIDGYNRGSHFNAAMPEFGAGDLGPTIIVENPDGTGTPIPARLLALADYLESLQR